MQRLAPFDSTQGRESVEPYRVVRSQDAGFYEQRGARVRPCLKNSAPWTSVSTVVPGSGGEQVRTDELIEDSATAPITC